MALLGLSDIPTSIVLLWIARRFNMRITQLNEFSTQRGKRRWSPAIVFPSSDLSSAVVKEDKSQTPALVNPQTARVQVWSSLRWLDGLIEPVCINLVAFRRPLYLPVPLEPAALAGGHDRPVHGRLADCQVPANPLLCLVAVTCDLLRLETRSRNPQYGVGVSLYCLSPRAYLPTWVVFINIYIRSRDIGVG